MSSEDAGGSRAAAPRLDGDDEALLRPDEGSAPTTPASPVPVEPPPVPTPDPEDTPRVSEPVPYEPDPADQTRPIERVPDPGDNLAVTFFLLVFALSIAGMYGILQGFLTDIILALVFSALSGPLYSRALYAVGPRRSAALVCVGIVVVVVLPSTFLIVSLSAEASSAIELTRSSVSLDRLGEILFGEGWIADRIRSLSEMMGVELTPGKLEQLIAGAAGALATLVYDGVNGVLANLVSFIFHFCIMLALTFYLLVDGHSFQTYIFKLSPLPAEHEMRLLDQFEAVGKAILFGNGIGSAIQGILGGLAMAAAGLPSPILWATVMAIFAFLPVVGISVVVLPATAYLALTGRYLAAIGFFAFCGTMALVVENVVKTRLMSGFLRSQIMMHDMLIFLSVLGGIAAYGVLGLLYGPLLVTLFLTLADLYQSSYKDRIQDPLTRTS